MRTRIQTARGRRVKNTIKNPLIFGNLPVRYFRGAFRATALHRRVVRHENTAYTVMKTYKFTVFENFTYYTGLEGGFDMSVSSYRK